MYSDNGGHSWKYGDIAAEDSKGRGNEVQMVELADGSIRLNSRSYNGAKFRKTAISRDGGVSWSPLVDVADLPEPQCNASIVRVSDSVSGDKNRLMYTGPASQSGRTHGTVFISYDEGETWPIRREITESHFAYSSAARLNHNLLGCLYEGGEKEYIEGIRLARFDLEWAAAGSDRFE